MKGKSPILTTDDPLTVAGHIVFLCWLRTFRRPSHSRRKINHLYIYPSISVCTQHGRARCWRGTRSHTVSSKWSALQTSNSSHSFLKQLIITPHPGCDVDVLRTIRQWNNNISYAQLLCLEKNQWPRDYSWLHAVCAMQSLRSSQRPADRMQMQTFCA